MNVRTPLVAGLAVSALIALAPVASAQTGAAPAPPIAQGPPITGYCVFSLNEIISGSKVGQAVVARLKVLGAQVSAELQPEVDSIRNDENALRTQASSMDQATLQARQANLQLRATNFEKREQLRQQEMQATQQKQLGVVGRQLTPIMNDIYAQRHCAVLIDADSGGVRIVNPSMDLSPAAISALDLKIQTLTFDREHLDTQAPAAAAAPPARSR
jgi:Skp family chaperone for outer membrane proteins